MKKLFLVPLALIFIIVGCADSNHNNDTTGGTVGKEVIQTPLANMSVDEAILKTASRMYYTELSEAGKATILMFLDVFQTGIVPTDGGKINEGSIAGFGTITNPEVASAVVQLLYIYAKDGKIDGIDALPDITTTNPFTPLLSYSTLSDQVAIQTALVNIRKMDTTTYTKIETAFKYIVQSQDTIANIARSYESRLLDSSSSASKTSGGGGTVLVDTYDVSANIAYTIALFPLMGNKAIVADTADVEAVSKLLYDFNEPSKLKISYNHIPNYFNIYDIATKEQIATTIIPVITDILISDIPGGSPVQGGQGDESSFTTTYPTETTDFYLTDNITARLYGAPDAQYISNMAKNRTLELHNKLREYGMKLPKGKTSDTGMENISSTVAKYLHENGYVYKNFNKSTSDFQTTLNAIIGQGGTTTTSIACQIVKEVNKAVDDAGKAFEKNKGFYTQDANNTLCNLPEIQSTERVDYSSK